MIQQELVFCKINQLKIMQSFVISCLGFEIERVERDLQWILDYTFRIWVKMLLFTKVKFRTAHDQMKSVVDRKIVLRQLLTWRVRGCLENQHSYAWLLQWTQTLKSIRKRHVSQPRDKLKRWLSAFSVYSIFVLTLALMPSRKAWICFFLLRKMVN